MPLNLTESRVRQSKVVVAQACLLGVVTPFTTETKPDESAIIWFKIWPSAVRVPTAILLLRTLFLGLRAPIDATSVDVISLPEADNAAIVVSAHGSGLGKDLVGTWFVGSVCILLMLRSASRSKVLVAFTPTLAWHGIRICTPMSCRDSGWSGCFVCMKWESPSYPWWSTWWPLLWQSWWSWAPVWCRLRRFGGGWRRAPPRGCDKHCKRCLSFRGPHWHMH